MRIRMGRSGRTCGQLGVGLESDVTLPFDGASRPRNNG